MRIISIFAIAILGLGCTSAPQAESVSLRSPAGQAEPSFKADFGISLSAVPVDVESEEHKDAVAEIMRTVGLSSTGNVYCLGEVRPSFEIRGFCQRGETVVEYRTSHLFDQTLAIVWFNPRNKRLHLLYSKEREAPGKPDAHHK
jgi:hypothetical protein